MKQTFETKQIGVRILHKSRVNARSFGQGNQRPTSIILLITLVCLISFNMLSQIQGPSHPLVNYGHVRTDITIDTICRYVSYEAGKEKRGGGFTYFARSDDKLRDTVTIASGLMRMDVYQFNEKNQLLYEHEFYPSYQQIDYCRSDYEYDNEGRLIKIISKLIRSADHSTKDILDVITFSYTDIQKAGNGYILNRIVYELDSLGRLTHEKYLDNNDSYKDFTDGKKYRINDNYYSYTDSSYTKLGYYEHLNYWITGMQDVWVKNTSYFNKKGHTKQITTLISTDGVHWITWSDVTFEYGYNDGDIQTNSGNEDTPLGNARIIKTNTAVYASSDAIQVATENAAMVQIFDLSGRLVKSQPVSHGETQISVPREGFYVVTVGNESFKVYVRR